MDNLFNNAKPVTDNNALTHAGLQMTRCSDERSAGRTQHWQKTARSCLIASRWSKSEISFARVGAPNGQSQNGNDLNHEAMASGAVLYKIRTVRWSC